MRCYETLILKHPNNKVYPKLMEIGDKRAAYIGMCVSVKHKFNFKLSYVRVRIYKSLKLNSCF